MDTKRPLTLAQRQRLATEVAALDEATDALCGVHAAAMPPPFAARLRALQAFADALLIDLRAELSECHRSE